MTTTKIIDSVLDNRFSPFRGPGGKSYLALFNICFIWGTTWPALRIAKDYIHPMQLAGVRQLIAGLFFVVYFLAKGHGWPTGRQLWQAFYLGLFMFVFSNGMSSWAMKYVTGGLGAIIGALSPLMMALLGAFIGKKEKLSWQTIMGLFLGAAGVAIIFYDHLNDLLNPEFRIGIILLFIAVLSWSFGSVIVAKKQKNVNPYYSAGWQMFFAGIIMNAWSYFGGYSISLLDLPWQGWVLFGYLIIFGSVVTFISYIYALKKLPTAQVSLYAYINPIIAIIIGWMFLHEAVTLYMIIGTLITLAGVYLVNRMLQQKAKQIIEEADQSQ